MEVFAASKQELENFFVGWVEPSYGPLQPTEFVNPFTKRSKKALSWGQPMPRFAPNAVTLSEAQRKMPSVRRDLVGELEDFLDPYTLRDLALVLGLPTEVAFEIEKTALVGPHSESEKTFLHRVPRALVFALRELHANDYPRVAAAWTARIADEQRKDEVPGPATRYSTDDVATLARGLGVATAEGRDVFVLVQQ